ncbi:MAG TPA: hypothetical protein VKS79_03790 [Gemmataceae bacterium]|nr:hypothetical protein [Gemmataceae bacterium]
MKALLTYGGLGLALLMAPLALAQQPRDPLLEDARRRQEIATQKAELDVKSALKEAASARAVEALTLLKRTLDRVESNVDIAPTNKDTMVRTLKERIRITEMSAKMTTEQAIAEAQKSAKANTRTAEADKQKAEREKIRVGINEIVQLQGKGLNAEADRKARDLAAQYPDNPAAKVMGTNAFLNARIREARDTLAEMEKRSQYAMNEVTRSSLPANGDVEFDKKRWGEITKARKAEPLSQKEKALIAALNKMVTPNFRNTKLEDALDTIAQLTGQTIILDKKGLEDVNTSADTLINFSLPREVSVRTVLRKILKDNDLTYVIKDEVIYVTSISEARRFMTTKAYYVGDLTVGNSIQNGAALSTYPFLNVNGMIVPNNPALSAQAGVQLADRQELETAEMIRKMIIDSIDPQSWKENGGPGTITYDRTTKSFVVRQSAEIQSLMRSSLLK